MITQNQQGEVHGNSWNSALYCIISTYTQNTMWDTQNMFDLLSPHSTRSVYFHKWTLLFLRAGCLPWAAWLRLQKSLTNSVSTRSPSRVPTRDETGMNPLCIDPIDWCWIGPQKAYRVLKYRYVGIDPHIASAYSLPWSERVLSTSLKIPCD